MSLLLEWILFIYVCGFIFKFIINIPLAMHMVAYYEEVHGEGCVENPWPLRLFPILLTALSWPYLLVLEKHRFFYCQSDAQNRTFFVSILSELKAQEKEHDKYS